MRSKIANILLDIHAVSLDVKKPFRYASGILSPIYCDNRLIISSVENRKKVIESFVEKIRESKLEFDVIAGTATAGIPHAAWIADRLDKPMIYIRGGKKGHGKGNQIEGKLEKGKRVIVIEDLISTGGSSIQAIQAIKEFGAEPVGCFAIFTYQMKKSEELFDGENCPYYTLSDFNTLVEVAAEREYILKSDKNIILEWNKNPDEWEKKWEKSYK